MNANKKSFLRSRVSRALWLLTQLLMNFHKVDIPLHPHTSWLKYETIITILYLQDKDYVS